MAEMVPFRLNAPPATLVMVVAISRLNGAPGTAHPVPIDVFRVGPLMVRFGRPHAVSPPVGVRFPNARGLTLPVVAYAV